RRWGTSHAHHDRAEWEEAGSWFGPVQGGANRQSRPGSWRAPGPIEVHPLNLRFLETFVWVARLRSFSLAAEKLCTTQAAVSNRISTLERDLGVRLFERDLRNVSLTPHGLRALPQAEAIVRMVGEFERAIGDTNSLRGTVMIGAIDSIFYAWLPRLIERVKE